ncbi:inverse autotransporter beta domain-containing protein [Rhizobium sp. PL01]|uniref:inverse autotransporter beta domain-containing protein n=1 Tax=Rhizobium sp. PL01 TaxID=3085631 RepID=UPI0029811E46|nr:inverse autotransporter beta domain-containing protein [Rhizobium sp. PL01]MDW5314437.1 right-handed parallel beta-helix repeat-containing protein [Rhizobium sp. PL01]
MNNKRILVYALAASSLAPQAVRAADWRPFAEIDGTWRSDDSAGSAGFFLPIVLESGNAIFIDTQGSFIQGGVQRGSIGAGYRVRQDNGWVLGAYGYYDYLNSSLDNSFHQLSLGAEALGPVFETRANFYLPLGSGKAIDGAGRGEITGGKLMFREGMERARTGADIEAGMRVPLGDASDKIQLKVFAGSYWYGGKNIDDMFGAKLRAELSFADLPGLPGGSTVTVGASGTFDNQDRLKGAAMARLRIPLGVPSSNSAADPFDPLLQRVERNGVIRTHRGATGDLENAVLDFNGETAGNVVNISAASGNAAAINSLLAAAGDNAIILADGTIGLDRSLMLGNGQLLLGGNTIIGLRGASSGSTGLFHNRGAATTLTGYNPAQDVLTMASNSTVSNLSITGGLAGIGSTGTSNVFIDDVDISGTSHDGIRLSNVDGAWIQRSSIHDLYICESSRDCEFSVYDPNRAPYAAISAHGTRNLVVADTHIDNVTYGLFSGSEIDESGWPPVITNAASTITLDNVTISRSRREALLFVAADDVVMNRVTVDNSAQDRDMDLVVLQGTSNVQITDMVLKGGINGLMLVTSSSLPEDSKTTDVYVNGLTIDGTRNAGIFLNPVSGIAFNNVSITNAGTYGAYVYGSDYEFLGGPVSDIAFNNVTIDKAGTAGFYFSGPSLDVTGDVTVTNTPSNCKVDKGWTAGSLTQAPGKVLTFNGGVIDQTNYARRCS